MRVVFFKHFFISMKKNKIFTPNSYSFNCIQISNKNTADSALYQKRSAAAVAAGEI
jgi:hypothetical protein